MQEIDDITLKAAQKGNKTAFKRLYDLYAPFVWRVVYRTAGGDEDAVRHIVQDTFIRIHGALKTYKREAALSTWIYRIAYNTAQSFLQKRKRQWERQTPFDDSIPCSEESVDGFDIREQVRVLLESCTPQERFLLTASAEGFSFEELSHISGKSEGALRVRLHRIKERIRKEAAYEKLA